MGDVYAAGNNVRITGNVTGDVFAAGGTVDVSGNVGQDVLIAGGSLNIRGAKIGDGLTMAGGNIFVSNDASVSGGLIFGGGNVNIDSPVNRGVVGGGGMVNLNNRVGKSAYIGAGNLNLGSGAIINGDLVFSGENDPVLAEGASVAGQISKIWPEKMTEAGRAGREAAEGGLKLGFKLWSYLAALLTGTVLLWQELACGNGNNDPGFTGIVFDCPVCFRHTPGGNCSDAVFDRHICRTDFCRSAGGRVDN